MKKIPLLSSFLLLCIGAYAQYNTKEFVHERLVRHDESKTMSRSASSHVMSAPLSGFINTPSVDLDWRPILVKRYEEHEHSMPDQELIDSLNAANFARKTSNLPKGNTAEKSTAVAPVVGSNFAGNTNDAVSPLDNSVAISYGGNIVSVENNTVAYYNTSGSQLYYQSDQVFLNDGSISGVTDPVVIYDPANDRFIFFDQETNAAKSNNRIILCFSKTNNPMDGWWRYEFPGDPTGNGYYFDYPKLAINDSNLFVTGNLFGAGGGGFQQAMLFQFDMLAGYNGVGSINYLYYPSIQNTPFTLLPVSYGQYGSYGPGILLVSANPSGGSSVNLYQVSDNICCSPTLNAWVVPTTQYSTPSNALQLNSGTALNIDNCRALSGFYLNGIVHFVFNSGNPTSSWDEINYNRLTLSPMGNQSTSFGNTGYDYGYPSVASFATTVADKSVMIGFGRTSNAIYPEVRAVICDDGMNWSPSALVKASTSYVSYTSTSVERWGDYTGVSRNHNSTNPSVWMNGMFGDNAHEWNTWIAEIHGGQTNTVKSVAANSGSKVYPNPVTENFTVEFSLEKSCEISISVLDITGKVVKELYAGNAIEGENAFTFNKSNLSNGTYILNIRTGAQIIKNEKIIVAN